MNLFRNGQLFDIPHKEFSPMKRSLRSLFLALVLLTTASPAVFAQGGTKWRRRSN